MIFGFVNSPIFLFFYFGRSSNPISQICYLVLKNFILNEKVSTSIF